MNSKKLLSLILASLMLSLPLFSCSNKGADGETAPDTTSDTSTTAAAESDTETGPAGTALDDGLGNPDFNGYNFRILSCFFGGDYGANRMMYDELTGSPVNDELYNSKTYIEDRFDVKYESIEIQEAADVQTTTRNSINASDNSFDIVINHDGMTFDLAKAGMFANMKSIDQFDFEKPWWPENSVNSLTVSGKLYCASSYLTYTGLHWTRAMIVNKDYADSIGMEIPYDLVREGKWTTDALLERVYGNSQDLDGNGKMTKDDRVAFVTGRETFYCLQESQDIPIYRYDDSGSVYMDIDVDKIDTYVQKWRALVESDDYYLSDDGFGETTFVNGNNLFCYGQIGDAYDIYRTTEMRYGFLPTPKFDEYQENYINCCTDLPWAIPKTAQGEQLDIISTLCEAISCYNYQKVLPAYFDVAMKSRAADSADDAEMLQIVADTRTISFGYSFGLPLNNILDKIGSQEAASFLKSSEKMATKVLEKLSQTFEEME